MYHIECSQELPNKWKWNYYMEERYSLHHKQWSNHYLTSRIVSKTKSKILYYITKRILKKTVAVNSVKYFWLFILDIQISWALVNSSKKCQPIRAFYCLTLAVLLSEATNSEAKPIPLDNDTENFFYHLKHQNQICGWQFYFLINFAGVVPCIWLSGIRDSTVTLSSNLECV